MNIDRKKLHHRLQQLRHIKTWQLLIILAFSVIISLALLRLNNLNMVDYRQAVLAADTTGDKARIKQSLLDLQRYVTQHMNTGLGQGIYLKSSFERDRAAALAAAADTPSNPASEVYKQASIDCRSRFRGGVESYRNDYVTCVQERVAALGSAADIASVKLPRTESYHYNFASPRFSFDLAGLSVALSGMIAAVIVSRWLMLLALRLLIHHRYRSL